LACADDRWKPHCLIGIDCCDGWINHRNLAAEHYELAKTPFLNYSHAAKALSLSRAFAPLLCLFHARPIANPLP
jgi:hypothetical protein